MSNSIPDWRGEFPLVGNTFILMTGEKSLLQPGPASSRPDQARSQSPIKETRCRPPMPSPGQHNNTIPVARRRSLCPLRRT
jgi:hypothetical protein